jgi:hypothetical protein
MSDARRPATAADALRGAGLGRARTAPQPIVGRDGPPPRHLSDVWVARVGRGRALPTRRRGLNWLMAVPVLMALPVPLFNRAEPRLFGLPFFYWYQLACVLLMIVVVTFVYLLTKGRRPRWTR